MTGMNHPDDTGERRPRSRYSRGSVAGGGRPVEGPSFIPDDTELPSASRAFLDTLLRTQLVGRSSVGVFLRDSAGRPDQLANVDALGDALVQAGLLTPYQLDRVQSGTLHGLILGNHRVLERLGSGSMGVVFLAEHTLLKRRVAVKVLPVDDNLPPALQERFYSEMRVLADLHHPNIVMAFDAGRLPAPSPGSAALHYMVMELVPGGDLEQHVIDHGILPIAQATDWIRQAACGLQEAHDHHLIHRDIKPSNLLLTLDGQVKLVDFGLARQFSSQLTDPSCLLGSIEFMPPEQSLDPSAVDGRADIYGLGATLFWILSGQTPYPEEKSVARALRALQCNRPRRLRSLRADVPPELDALIDKMLERDPAQRPALPVTVMNALNRFAAPAAPPWEIYDIEHPNEPAAHVKPSSQLASTDSTWKVLIVHNEPAMQDAIRKVLEPLGCMIGDVADGDTALSIIRDEPCDLVLLKQNLPDMTGYEVCKQLRERPPRAHIKIVVLSDRPDKNDLAEALARGADECVAYPLDLRRLAAKVQYMLRLKDAQDRTDILARNLLLANRQLEDSLQARAGDVRQAHDALLFAMAKMAEQREGETAGHCRRLQHYCRMLGEQLADDPAWATVVSAPFLQQVERCVPLHDIGKIGLPDSLLTKPGPLDASERALMETHTLIGASMLDALGREYGESLGFLAAATVIVRYHHERYDGQGYPDGLSGDSIPPAGRIVALADVYDALRRKRFHKPALTHEDATRFLLQRCDGQFDPAVLEAFEARQERFKKIYQQMFD
jgi:response regulator RpfG family c-di-GMP phosphodiesterase/tRNA A-37 threonylcarbamoyl transferase component Bud32